MHFAAGIIPIQRDTNILSTRPIDGNLVVLLEGVDQMLRIIFAGILYPEVVDNKGESCLTCSVSPRPGMILLCLYP